MYVPFFFGAEDAPSGARFGGSPPERVTRSETQRYLLTVPLLSTFDLELSVLLDASPDYVREHEGQWLTDESVEVRVHPRSRRGSVAADFPGHVLRLRPPAEESREPYAGGKLGGRAHLLHPDNQPLLTCIRDAEAEGFSQVLQLDLPLADEDEARDIEWPFGSGAFHLFGREPYGSDCWAWFWELR